MVGLIKVEGATLSLEGGSENHRALVYRSQEGGASPVWSMDLGAEHRIIATRFSDNSIEMDLELFPHAKLPEYGSLKLELRASLSVDTSIAGTGHCDLVLRVENPSFPLDDLAFPGPVRMAAEQARGWKYLLPYGEGVLVSPEGNDPHSIRQVSFHDYKTTMPFVAAVHNDGSSLIVSTRQGHDHAVKPIYGLSGSTGIGLELVQLSSLGTWRYDRTWRITHLPSGGLNGISQAMRSELRTAGLQLTPITEKIANLPVSIRQSLGGTHVWCHMDTLTTDFVNDVAESGVQSLLIMGRPADATVTEAVRQTGYASGPYFQTFDVFPPGLVTPLEWRNTYPPEGASHGFPNQLRRDRNGFLDYGWNHVPIEFGDRNWTTTEILGSDGRVTRRSHALHSKTPVQSYRRCQIFHQEVIEQHGLPMLDRVGATAVFYDINTTMVGLECSDPRHPCDRRMDVELRQAALERLLGTDRIVLSEDGKWWAVDLLHGFEGGLNYDGMEALDNTTLTDYDFDPSNWETEFNLEHRVPMFSMVMGFTVTSTFWWGRGQDRHAQTRRAKDAFAALIGGNPIFVVDPDHPLRPGSQRWHDFVATARSFDLLREQVLGVPISRYDVHSRHHATTVFENGVTVTANVGPDGVADLDPGEYRVHSARGDLVTGNGPLASS